MKQFGLVFEEIAAAGRDVLVLTISSGMSDTFNFALQARKAALEKHPEMKIR